MLWTSLAYAVFLSLGAVVSAHYTFPRLIVNDVPSSEWQYVRRTDNFETKNPLTDVSSTNFRCYDEATRAGASTVSTAAGTTVAFNPNQKIGHPGVLNVYMAKAPGSVAGWDGSGRVWFRIYEVPADTWDGSMSFPASNITYFHFDVPSNLPSGEYLMRIEHIALHNAAIFGGAEFYVSCGQIKITGGGSGTPGPLVSIPGVYTGLEVGILVNIYYSIRTPYIQPGPPVWWG